MNIKEQVGDFIVLEHREITVFKNNEINISLFGNNENPLKLRIVFKDDKEKVGKIMKDVDYDILTLTFCHHNTKFTYGGFPEPLDIGTTKDGKPIYFSCSINFVDTSVGYIIFNYTFWEKEDNKDG